MQSLIFARNLALTALLAGSLAACGTEPTGALEAAAEERAAELAADPDAPVDAADLFLLLVAAAERDAAYHDAGELTLRARPALPVEAPGALTKGESADEVTRRQGLRASTSPDPAPEIDDGDPDAAEKEAEPCKGPFARLCGAASSPTRIEYQPSARAIVPASNE